MSEKNNAILNRLQAGWRVDAEAGRVYGLNGKEIGYLHRTGYVKTSTWRGEQTHPLVVKRAQVVWVSVHGPVPPGLMIDHINGVRHDDRISNLRLVDAAENSRNRHD